MINYYYFLNNIDNNNLKNLKSFCGKRDALNCAGIRARVFQLPAKISSSTT